MSKTRFRFFSVSPMCLLTTADRSTRERCRFNSVATTSAAFSRRSAVDPYSTMTAPPVSSGGDFFVRRAVPTFFFRGGCGRCPRTVPAISFPFAPLTSQSASRARALLAGPMTPRNSTLQSRFRGASFFLYVAGTLARVRQNINRLPILTTRLPIESSRMLKRSVSHPPNHERAETRSVPNPSVQLWCATRTSHQAWFSTFVDREKEIPELFGNERERPL